MIPLRPLTMIYFGYSSSPKHCLLLEVTQLRVKYRMWPYTPGTALEMPRWEMDMLAQKGLNTRLAALRHANKCGGGDLYQPMIEEIEATIRGDGPTVDPVSLECIHVRATYIGTEAVDPWYIAERYGNVGAEGAIYCIDTDRGRLAEMQASGAWTIESVASRS